MNSKEIKNDVERVTGIRKTLIVAEMASESINELKQDMHDFNQILYKEFSCLKELLKTQNCFKLFMQQFSDNLGVLEKVKSFHTSNTS